MAEAWKKIQTVKKSLTGLLYSDGTSAQRCFLSMRGPTKNRTEPLKACAITISGWPGET